jgi:Flp pilus assembly protein TadD
LDGAIADYSKVLELKPDYTKAYSNRGLNEFVKNNFDSAISDETRAIQLNSKDANAYSTRGWAFYQKGNVAGALEDCKKAVGLEGVNSLDAAADQGMIDFMNGDYENAVAAWEKTIQHDASVKPLLQPWIEKAKAKQSAAK